MRGIVFTLLFTFVGCQKNDPVPGFGDMKSYLYNYKGLILNGLKNGDLAKSGIKITCQIIISKLSQETHVLKVLSPQLEQFNGIRLRHPFIKASEVTERIRLCFIQAFKFEYRNGHVINIYAPEDASVMCVNIIRGILNLLQLTIEKSQKVYELQEVGVEGTCLTKYFIQDDKKKNKFTVFRIKDLNNCSTKVVKNIGIAYVRPCPTCPITTTNTRRTVAFNYNLKYIDARALIMHVESREVYEISPFSDLSGSAIMEAKQELTLIATVASQLRIPEILLKNHGNLHYQFPEDLPQMAVHLIDTSSPELKIVETLEHLVQQNQFQIYTGTPIKFLQLIELFRATTQENLVSLWKQFADRQLYRYWLLSGVTAAGTRNTFEFLKHRIHNKDFSTLESAITLTLAFHLTQIDEITLKMAADILVCPIVQKSPLLRKLVYLGFGSMINRHCSASSDCPAEMLQPLHDLSKVTHIRRKEDIRLALKAIGNAGQPASINIIKKFLPGFSVAANTLSERIHVDAVLALRKIARKNAATVREIVFQIMMNSTISPQVRMVACIVFFETKPGLVLVTAAASAIQMDNRLQFASFVASHMKALAMGRIPQLQYLSAACNIALKLLRPNLERLSLRYSKVFHTDIYSMDYRVGALGRLYVMNSPSTLFQTVIGKIRGFYATSAMDIVEVGLHLGSLTDILKRQDIPFAQYSAYTKLKELGKLLQEWKELPSQRPLVSAYLKLFSYEIAFGAVDGEFIQVAEKLLARSAELLISSFQKGITKTWTQPIMAGELRQIVPICVGLPLEFGLYSSSVVHAEAEEAMLCEAAHYKDMDVLQGIFHASYKVGICTKSELVEPSSDVVRVNGQIFPPMAGDLLPNRLHEANFHLHAEMTASIHTDLVAVMGINTPHFQNGLEFRTKFYASIPMNFDANLDMKEENLIITIVPVQKATELLAMRMKLYAISRNMDELNSAKMFPIFPEVPGFDLLHECLKTSEEYVIMEGSTENGFSSKKFTAGFKDNFHYEEEKTLELFPFYVKLHALGYQTCLTVKQCKVDSLGETYLQKILGKCELMLVLAPGAARTKIQLEVQAESGSKTVHLRPREQGSESFPLEEQRAERKKENFEAQHQSIEQAKASGLEVTFSTIQNHRKHTLFHLELYENLHSSRPTVQILLSDLNGSKRMKVCAEVSILDSQHAEGYLKWGQDCQDYKTAGKIAYGHFSGYPAMEIKLEQSGIPPAAEAAVKELSTLIPGTAYMLGFTEVEQENPPQQVSVVVVLTSPRTCALVFRLPHITFYDTNIQFPVPLPVNQHKAALALPSHAWDFVSYLPNLAVENLKGYCSVSQDSITTFNGVKFQYKMPTSSYHVVAWDCSSELKFLVMAKQVEPSSPLKNIHLKLANLDIDVLPSNGHIQMWINGSETLEENLPYISTSGGYIFINRDESSFLLKAPDTGIESLYYDGKSLKIQLPFWMSGKNCGICGRYDAEYEEEYKMPNGTIAENEKSFAQSWMVPEEWATAFVTIPQ